jgi:HK97 family phage prohead protease
VIKSIERRISFADFEVRDGVDGTVGLRGYAAMFEHVAHGEMVGRAAFNRTLQQRDNVRLLINHDGVPIASTKSGTMTLSTDERGLVVDVPALDMSNPTVQELVSAMRRGDIGEMSFAFEAKDAPMVDGVRELREVKLFDVSVVTYPWYDTTSVELNFDKARMAFRALSEDERRELISIEVNIDGSTISDSSTETEMSADGMCPMCGQPVPAESSVTDVGAMPVSGGGTPDGPVRTHSVAEARALLDLASA